ncbi:MAG: NAD(P)-binding protein, partial [Actinomycetota bacterium]
MSRYCIIGGGPAGLASLKAMLDAGYDVDCFEKSDTIGGHWNHD